MQKKNSKEQTVLRIRKTVKGIKERRVNSTCLTNGGIMQIVVSQRKIGNLGEKSILEITIHF